MFEKKKKKFLYIWDCFRRCIIGVEEATPLVEAIQHVRDSERRRRRSESHLQRVISFFSRILF
jgi:hypothetical protein